MSTPTAQSIVENLINPPHEMRDEDVIGSARAHHGYGWGHNHGRHNGPQMTKRQRDLYDLERHKLGGGTPETFKPKPEGLTFKVTTKDGKSFLQTVGVGVSLEQAQQMLVGRKALGLSSPVVSVEEVDGPANA